jgi:hypothetical protein
MLFENGTDHLHRIADTRNIAKAERPLSREVWRFAVEIKALGVQRIRLRRTREQQQGYYGKAFAVIVSHSLQRSFATLAAPACRCSDVQLVVGGQPQTPFAKRYQLMHCLSGPR